MKEEEKVSTETNTRRKLLAGIGLLSLFPLLKFSLFSKKEKVVACSPSEQSGTVKMLTKEGKLVEVDISKINSTKEKISDKDLLAWVKR